MIIELYTLGHNDLKENGEVTPDILTQACKNNWGNFKSREEYHLYNLLSRHASKVG